VKEVGDPTRQIKDGEQRWIEDELLMTDLTGRSPIMIQGTTSVCEQQPWIQNGKVRENVLFGTEFDKRRYVDTIMSCQLETDLSLMPAGDMTEIGEKGINLSGGQKARLALARAVYARPDVLIMDDPISALDPHVRKDIFDQVFCGLMKGKTQILVTHAVEFIHLADHVIVVKDGSVQAQGTYEDLKSHPYMQEIQDIHSKNKREIQKANTLEKELGSLDVSKKSKSTIGSTSLSAKDFESPALTRRASLQLLSKRQPSQGSATNSEEKDQLKEEDKESSTKEHTPIKK
jgi:ABC-type sulfate/molybdate transport systems ATPase subunit